MYRLQTGRLQVLLAHPGGPFFRNRDEGVWTIPKGEVETGEDLLEVAKREFFEETGPLDLLLVCLGGGGLISGCAVAARQLAVPYLRWMRARRRVL